MLVKQGKLFAYVELVKSYSIAAGDEICPEKINLLNTVILLARPVAPKINDIWEPHQ